MSSPSLNALDGLVSLSRLGRTTGRLEEFLSGVAETAAATVGFRVAALNLYRPADDDFIVTTVVGSDAGHRQLIGTTIPGTWSRRIFTEAFEVERMYFVPAGSIDWDDDESPITFTPDLQTGRDPEAWQPMDVLIAPLVAASGETIGFLSLDEPIDGLRPDARRIKALAAVAAQASITVEHRQAERAAIAHSAALTHLVGAAASLGALEDEQAVLDTFAHVLRTSLGFGHVVTLHGESLDASGVSGTAIVATVREHVPECDGTYLLPPALVDQLCPEWRPHRSPGEGPRAWAEHLMLIPLLRSDGTLAAIVRLAQPQDRLLPDEDRVALVGLLTAQASAALESTFGRTLRHQRDRAVHLARHDETTGLPNRFALAAALDHLHDRSVVAAIVAIGLDDFAIVREALGHDHAEATLRAVAERLGRLAGHGRLHRLDGEVLGLLLDGTIEDALARADTCRRALADPFEVAGTEHRIGATIGIAAVESDAAETLRRADVARLHARRERVQSAVYDPSIDDAAFRLARVAALRTAPERGELELHFQPIVDAQTRELAALEALVRWRHGGRLIPPLEFIGLAESSGLIERVGDWVIGAAMEQARAWTDAGLDVPAITVNVAPRQLRNGRLAGIIGNALTANDLGPAALIVEITESGLQPDARVNGELQALKALGVRIAVDDFGADYSSLSRLRELPVSILKIDRAFLRDVPGDARAIDLVQAIMSLGSALGLQVVVEGVEHDSQAELIANSPVPVLWQGFLTARPLPADEIVEHLRARR